MMRQKTAIWWQQGIRKELGLSAGLHILLILGGMMYLPLPDGIAVPEQALPVDIISIDEFTRLVRPSDDMTEQEKDVSAEPTASEARPSPPPAPPLPQQAPVAPDAITALPPPSDNAAMTEEPDENRPVNLVANPRPLARPTPSAAIRQPDIEPILDLNRVSALLDKTPNKPPPSVDNNVAVAAGERLTLSEIDAFRVQMRRCWHVPAGAANADDLLVRVRLGLNTDGTLAAGPFVVNRAQIANPYFRAAAESVLRAIRRCQPFQMPADKYYHWREMELNFDPREMLGR